MCTLIIYHWFSAPLSNVSFFSNAEFSTIIRTTIQVKTHAQMVMKRQEAGEDIFAELEDGDNWAPEVRTETTIFRDSVHTQQRQNKASSTGSQPISDAIDMTAAQILVLLRTDSW
mmetsp:Transcript_38291/g.55943  ORF Transcript_38291/g.55943 Transcript_38291/m.55943 type:complete len:115 (-) Transcript_38291:425-769(-)